MHRRLQIYLLATGSMLLLMLMAAACTTSPAAAPVAAAPLPSKVPTVAASPIPSTPTIAPTDCKACHSDIFSNWQNGAHANTQADVATELGSERSGQTPADVIQGPDAEDCIACHSPTAVTLPGLGSETDALGHFFSTTDGKFTADTKAINTSEWPQLDCGTCHAVSANHQTDKLSFGTFDSQTGQFVAQADSSQVCGQCHGNLLIPGTDHQTYNAWTTSKHSATQADVATELGASRSGQTAEDVINGQDAENCIACHAPTAVLANGEMTEAQALAYFFSTSADGKFSSDTATAHSAEWPNVSCTACHDPHNPKTPAYFNSATKQYEVMKTSSELCGQCHGNLRFPDTDHLSYNINAGTGGMGVPDQQMTPNTTCTDCHMYVSGVDGSNSTQQGGHSWAISVKEADGQATTSCVKCHPDWTTAKSDATIKQLQTEFQALDAKVQDSVGKATKAMDGVTDAALADKLKEAQFNLSYAESDESGGFHNHTYLMALLTDAQTRAQEVLTALGK
jgi:nitrate/TMAO reductase-like tetraheme cytochrome c subunit